MTRPPHRLASSSILCGLAFVFVVACDSGDGDTAGEETTAGSTSEDTSPNTDDSTTGDASEAEASSGGDSSTGEPQVPCDQMESCSMCIACAGNNDCSDLQAACLDNPACVMLTSCLAECADDVCIDNCYTNNPDGEADYQALQVCNICDTCPTQCADIAPAWCE